MPDDNHISTERPRIGAGMMALVLLLLAVSAYDLLSPHFSSPTILRQTYTAMLSENFARAGFALQGLYLNIFGAEKPVIVYEFPLYNALAGLFFRLFSYHPVWGKLVSLLASLAALAILVGLVRRHYDDRTAFVTGFFFIVSPLGVMMRTAFQPDALALACVLSALVFLLRWRSSDHALINFALCCLFLLAAGLTKYPVLMPYLPLIVVLGLFPHGPFRLPRLTELVVLLLVFFVPFVSWYLYRGTISDARFITVSSAHSMFLLGDLRRFLSPAYYTIPFFSLAVLACSGVGFLFFTAGLSGMRRVEWSLLLGIPFYFVMIPTARDQHYYLFACLPAIALLMARGWLNLQDRLGRVLACPVPLTRMMLALFLLSFTALSLYVMVLRDDRIMRDAAQATGRYTGQDDLVLSLTMHSKTALLGGQNTTLFYLSHRRGWNIVPGNLTAPPAEMARQVEAEIEQKRSAGAKWLLVTWYSPDIEPPVERFIPAIANTRLDPGLDGFRLFAALQERYKPVFTAANFALLRLGDDGQKSGSIPIL